LLDDLGIRFLEWPLRDRDTAFYGWAACRILIVEAAAEIEGRPDRPEPWTDLMNAWGESQVGRPDRARAALSRIAPEDAQTAVVCAARAHILLALGEPDRARQDLEAAIRLEPENVLARITRGRLALAENRPEAAADDLMRALARWPDSRDEFDLRSVIDRLIVTNDAVFARAVALRPSDPQVWVARGRHLAWRGRWKDASDAFAKGITSRPPASDWVDCAAVLVLAGDDAGYRRLCDRIVEHTKKVGSDRNWFTYYTASRISGFSSASGVAPELMVHWADAARAMYPNQPWLDYFAGAARLCARNQDAEALRLLNSASKQMPLWNAAGMTWYALAIVHRRLGHDADARRWLERADSWMADRNREAAMASTVLPKLPVRDYLEAKILQREAKSQ
jgi:predicted Zn-dependent protease